MNQKKNGAGTSEPFCLNSAGVSWGLTLGCWGREKGRQLFWALGCGSGVLAHTSELANALVAASLIFLKHALKAKNNAVDVTSID